MLHDLILSRASISVVFLFLSCRDLHSKQSILCPAHLLTLRHHSQVVKIGGDPKKAHLQVPGLKALEFMVVQQGEKTLLLDVETGMKRGEFREDFASTIYTSNPEIQLTISLDQTRLRC